MNMAKNEKMKKIYTENEAERFLKRYVKVADSVLTKDYKTAEKFSKKKGYPVVLKIISKQALHKTDIGGVKIVKSEEQLEKNFNALLKIAKTKKIKIDGILVQEFLHGCETIIGIKKDPVFGHVVMFGTGGVLTELFKDVSFRVCPITEKEADDMIYELKGKKLLNGFRGAKPVNIKLLKSVLVKVSKIPLKNKDIEEMDINPFIINEKTGKVADARIVFAD
jgi:3-hydroxypropionyl-CoA synthetase (ADP-forming)